VIMPVLPAIVLCLLFVSPVTLATIDASLKLHLWHAHHVFGVVQKRMQPHDTPLLLRLCPGVVPWSSASATVALVCRSRGIWPASHRAAAFAPPPCWAPAVEVQSRYICCAWLLAVNLRPLPVSLTCHRHPNPLPGRAAPPWSTASRSLSIWGALTHDQRTQSNLREESRVDLWTWLTGPYRARSNGLVPAH
jgi:hypothetical protein